MKNHLLFIDKFPLYCNPLKQESQEFFVKYIYQIATIFSRFSLYTNFTYIIVFYPKKYKNDYLVHFFEYIVVEIMRLIL